MPLTSQGRFRNLYSKLHVLNFIRNPQIPCFRMDGNVMFLWYYSTFFLYFDNPTCSVAFHCHIGNCPGLTTAESCSSDFCWLSFSFVNSYDPTFTEFDCFLETFPVILWLSNFFQLCAYLTHVWMALIAIWWTFHILPHRCLTSPSIIGQPMKFHGSFYFCPFSGTVNSLAGAHYSWIWEETTHWPHHAAFI